MTPTTNVARKACVVIILAALILFCDRCIAAITDEPIPDIIPNATAKVKIGDTIFTEANPSLPTPCPMKIPSVIQKRALKSIPKIVGMSILANICGMFPFPKSIISLSRFFIV